MQSSIDLDRKCNAELRHEIGERLRRELSTDKAQLPPRLTILLNRLREQEKALKWVASASIAPTGTESEVSDAPSKRKL